MIQINSSEDFIRLRRIALAAQGLLKNSPFGDGLTGANKAISHIGYVQLDSISVVQRAHHHSLYSRVPNYSPDMLASMLENKAIFEYWAHAAAFLPIADFRFSLLYKHAIKSGQTHWYKNSDRKLMNELLTRIRIDGPLRSRDIKSNKSKSNGWWDWKPAKKALEQLYMEGDLMVSSREGFEKVYELTERVLPADVNLQMPSLAEFAAHILEQQLRCHGLVSIKGLTYLRRNTKLKEAIKTLVNTRSQQGLLEQLQFSNGESYFLPTGAFEQPRVRVSEQLKILSPFDNSVIQRERLKSLFQFNYQLECYVPEAKRQYGYFCLPLLFGDVFIGRMDCKVHRKTAHLEIKSLHLDANELDITRVITAFGDAIIKFIAFQQCNSVSLTQVYPQRLTAVVQNILKSLQ
ncbi:winged helix DNA-binding domain-containing protein [Pseudoalteromonas sp. KG3]|uniref:Winged helix-turn-helix domain-containing protein n=1 Tax=Pseudoalteromonas prydzensis TaxID=182141 RepID=A0ABR9FNR0_9GAMM|nr:MULTISPECIES: crosslink repair DNA glycosylase YcaQ family protein [Pseudoalteromonas]MBE0458430.1 winged helix-turn-helix domain-containing protein [Pseudoalteromonas prydzensis]WKD24250.1 winged helix DNA-binding domain-containing protein [Pseudoalteromonas sp. KG3]